MPSVGRADGKTFEKKKASISVVCPKCQGSVFDNRSKKLSGEFKPNAPDFACANKEGCGWKQWPPKVGATTVVSGGPIVPPSTTQSAPSPRDTLILELFWDSFDRVLEGVAKRRLTDMFKPEQLCSLIATMYIQRARG